VSGATFKTDKNYFLNIQLFMPSAGRLIIAFFAAKIRFPVFLSLLLVVKMQQKALIC